MSQDMHAKLSFPDLAVVQFTIREGISKLFEIEIIARSAKHDLKLSDYVDQDAKLEITGRRKAVFQGIVQAMECTKANPRHPDLDRGDTSMSTYYLRIVPKMWRLTQRRSHRIFQHQTTPDIVCSILKEHQVAHGVDGKNDVYPTLEYRTQYGETDFAFVCRLLEEAGMWFELTRDEMLGQTMVMLCDKWRDAPSEQLPFVDEAGSAKRGDYVTRVHLCRRSRPGRVELRDFDLRRPEHLLESKAHSQTPPEDTWQRYAYTPGGFLIDLDNKEGATPVADARSTARHDDDTAKRLAERCLGAERHEWRVVELETEIISLSPGTVFDIEEHPDPDVSKRFAMIESMITGLDTGNLRLTGKAVFKDDPFRMPLATPSAKVLGMQSAVVVGPKGTEIHTDELGRVRVHFHWDTDATYDDSRTCWLRVSQGWAGPGYGAMTIPRVGHEVLVDFLGGDPNQPIVIGRLYNGTAPHPYKLPDERTRSVWRTQTSPFEDDHHNELSFEDAADRELVYVQAQRNLMRLTKRHETRRIVENRTDVVGDSRVAVVSKIDSINVATQHLTQMFEEKNLEILTQKDPQFAPADTFFKVVNERIELRTPQAQIVLDGENISVQANAGIRFSASKDLIIEGSNIFLNCHSIAGEKTDAEGEAVDDAEKPKGRVAPAVAQLLRGKGGA